MPLTPGTRLRPYPTPGSLGAGGMGEVDWAKDTKRIEDPLADRSARRRIDPPGGF
jgi:hypothetical protein